MSERKTWEKYPEKYPFVSVNRFGVVGHHKTAEAAAKAAIRFKHGRVERLDRRPQDFAKEMAKAERWHREYYAPARRNEREAVIGKPKPDLNSEEMKRRRALAVRKMETRKQFDQSSSEKDLLKLFARLSSESAYPGGFQKNPYGGCSTYHGGANEGRY